ncbi:MAG: hypothetical protein JKX87_07625 [Cycloclasticus sp.]|nr:hypothetical protein [Cycloclasticus sp.]
MSCSRDWDDEIKQARLLWEKEAQHEKELENFDPESDPATWTTAQMTQMQEWLINRELELRRLRSVRDLPVGVIQELKNFYQPH